MSSAIHRDSRIYVAGHRGLVGSALVRRLTNGGYRNLVLRTHAELDLTERAAVQRFFADERPEFVFLAAARVGGIMANSSYPAEFIQQNLLIQTNVIHEAWRSGVRRLLFLGSSCIYPGECPQPIKEEYLLTGPLEPTNRPYAVAKIAGIEMCWAYNRQYGTRYWCAMPANVYGPGDNYDLETSHVLPALLRKFHGAKGKPAAAGVVLWGSGKPRREFIHSDDLADACVHVMARTDAELPMPSGGGGTCAPIINIGCGEDRTISELAALVARVVGYEGKVAWDTSKPDGTYQKRLDVARLSALGWRPKMRLEEGVRTAYEDYVRRASRDVQ